MKIQIVNRIIDDNGVECKEGEDVLIKTNTMESLTLARIHKIMPNLATFFFDDRKMGFRPISYRPEDIIELRKYTKPKNTF